MCWQNLGDRVGEWKAEVKEKMKKKKKKQKKNKRRKDVRPVPFLPRGPFLLIPFHNEWPLAIVCARAPLWRHSSLSREKNSILISGGGTALRQSGLTPPLTDEYDEFMDLIKRALPIGWKLHKGWGEILRHNLRSRRMKGTWRWEGKVGGNR